MLICFFIAKKEFCKIIGFVLLFFIVIILFSALVQPRSKYPLEAEKMSKTDITEIQQNGTYQIVNAGVTPRYPFYFFDTAGEWAVLKIFTFNPAKQAERSVIFMQEKASEVKKLQKKRAPSFYIQQSLDEHTRYLIYTKKFLEKQKQRPDGSALLQEVATRISESANRQIEALMTPEETATAAAVIITNISDIFQYTQNILLELFLQTDTIEQLRYAAEKGQPIKPLAPPILESTTDNQATP